MASDRIFGLVILFGALAYIAGALQLQTSFLSDPVGPRTFPLLIGGVSAICGAILLWKPDPDPHWPTPRTFLSIGMAVGVMIAYAYTLKPLGFLLPTAVAAGVLSYQISPRPLAAVLTGIGLSGGLFIIFKFALKLSLVAVPRWLLS